MMGARLLYSLISTRKILCKSYNSHQKSALTFSQWKQTRHFCSANIKKPNENLDDETEKDNLNLVVNSKLKPFDDKDAPIIFDVDEEQQLLQAEALEEQEIDYDPFKGLNVKRGVKGVYDIEDLVEVLRHDKAKDIFVASVPANYGYVDYIVVVSAKSHRHMHALAAFVRKLYKRKRNPTDRIPNLEGKNSKDWVALDLGNIALHILSKLERQKFDLETLWSVGPEYDDKCQETDESTDLMEQYNTFLDNLEPQVPEKKKKFETPKTR